MKPPPLTPESQLKRIESAVTQSLHVSRKQLASTSRNHKITWARHVLFYLTVELTGLTQQRAADLLKQKNHTAIWYGVTRVKDDISVYPKLAREVQQIRERCAV